MFETIKSIPLTFFSALFYWDVARRRQGIGFYFILLLALIGFVTVMTSSFQPLRQTAEQLRALVEDLPVVTVKNNAVSIDRPAPYVIDMDKYNKAQAPDAEKEKGGLIVIDTGFNTGDVDALIKHMKDEKIAMLLTADRVVLYDRGQLRVNTLQSLPDIVMTQEKWQQIGRWIGMLFIPFMALFFGVMLLVTNLISVTFGAVILKCFTLFIRLPPDFAGLMRLVAAASVPVRMVSMAWPHIPVLLSFAVWGGYVGFAMLSACKKPPVAAVP